MSKISACGRVVVRCSDQVRFSGGLLFLRKNNATSGQASNDCWTDFFECHHHHQIRARRIDPGTIGVVLWLFLFFYVYIFLNISLHIYHCFTVKTVRSTRRRGAQVASSTTHGPSAGLRKPLPCRKTLVSRAATFVLATQGLPDLSREKIFGKVRERMRVICGLHRQKGREGSNTTQRRERKAALRPRGGGKGSTTQGASSLSTLRVVPRPPVVWCCFLPSSVWLVVPLLPPFGVLLPPLSSLPCFFGVVLPLSTLRVVVFLFSGFYVVVFFEKKASFFQL